jgi:hypothetical protein
VAAALAEVLAGVLDVEQVSVDAHFFDDLGADSMVMARFCARARKRGDLPSVSIKDVYRHPTAASLAGAFAPVAPPAAAPLRLSRCPRPRMPRRPDGLSGHGEGPGAGTEAPGRWGRCTSCVGRCRPDLPCVPSVAALVAVRGATGFRGLTRGDLYRRSVVFLRGFCALCALPIVGKGRRSAGRPRQIRV